MRQSKNSQYFTISNRRLWLVLSINYRYNWNLLRWLLDWLFYWWQLLTSWFKDNWLFDYWSWLLRNLHWLIDWLFDFHGFWDVLHDFAIYHRLYWHLFLLFNLHLRLHDSFCFWLFDCYLILLWLLWWLLCLFWLLLYYWNDGVSKLLHVIINVSGIEESRWGLGSFFLSALSVNHEPLQVVHHFFTIISCEHPPADFLHSALKVRRCLFVFPNDLGLEDLNDFSEMAFKASILLHTHIEVSGTILRSYFERQVLGHFNDLLGDRCFRDQKCILYFDFEA